MLRADESQDGGALTEATTPARSTRSTVGLLALAAVAISAIGIAIILLGIAFDIEGAEEGEETSGLRVIFDIAWLSYLLGAIGALALGIAALVIGRRRGDARATRAGTIALGWVAIAVVIALIAGATS